MAHRQRRRRVAPQQQQVADNSGAGRGQVNGRELQSIILRECDDARLMESIERDNLILGTAAVAACNCSPASVPPAPSTMPAAAVLDARSMSRRDSFGIAEIYCGY